MRRISIIILALAFCLALAGCGGSSQPGEYYPDESYGDEDYTDEEYLEELSPIEVAEQLWSELIERTISEDTLGADAEMMNAIVSDIVSSVIDADEASMTVYISYPDAAVKLSEEIDALPAEPTQEDVDKMYRNVKSAVENYDLEYIDVTLELELAEAAEGYKKIVISPELAVAMTGGIAGME